MSSSNPYPDKERPVASRCDPRALHVRLADDRTVSTPLWWYPRLIAATPAQRNTVELMLDGVHWPDIDEDLSIRGMLSGWRHPKAQAPEAKSSAIAAE